MSAKKEFEVAQKIKDVLAAEGNEKTDGNVTTVTEKGIEQALEAASVTKDEMQRVFTGLRNLTAASTLRLGEIAETTVTKDSEDGSHSYMAEIDKNTQVNLAWHRDLTVPDGVGKDGGTKVVHGVVSGGIRTVVARNDGVIRMAKNRVKERAAEMFG